MGLSVNKIRQKYAGNEAASVAKKLIKSWKKLLPGKNCPVVSDQTYNHINFWVGPSRKDSNLTNRILPGKYETGPQQRVSAY